MMRKRNQKSRVHKKLFHLTILTLALSVGCIMADGCFASEDSPTPGIDRPCSSVVSAAFKAAKNEIEDDYWISYGKCLNLSDVLLRVTCLTDAGDEFNEGKLSISDQFEARKKLCSDLGEKPYDPFINPDEFVNFEMVLNNPKILVPNTYFPLVPGMTRVYIVRDQYGKKLERIKVEVLSETKEILGVNCIVVRDRVWKFNDGGKQVIVEDTEDWYAQDYAGNVWYFGEIAKNFENGALVHLEGSWKAGRDYDMPGIMMLVDPQEGGLYRQEFSLGNAEDMARVDGHVDSVTVRGKTYDNILKTIDFTPIDPGMLEYKYYAPGIGLVKEEKPDGGEIVELVRHSTP